MSLLGDVSDFSHLPLWLATGPGEDKQAAAACGVRSDTGGPIVFGQALVGSFDADVACAPSTKPKTAGPLSATTRLSGSGLPGTTVSLRVRDLAGASIYGPVTAPVSPGGTWNAKVPFTRDARVTVSGDSGSSSGDLRPKVGVTLSARHRPDGTCAATLTGTTTTWWKGQNVQLRGGTKTVTVESRRTGHGGGSYSAVVSGVCGRGRSVTAAVDGKAGRQRLTEPGTSPKLQVHVNT